MSMRFFLQKEYIPEQPGDAVFLDDLGGVVIVPQKELNDSFRWDALTPYGVVVLPSWHNRYNDDTMGIMCLKDTGYMPYGPGGHDSIFDSLPFEFIDDAPVLETIGPKPYYFSCPIAYRKGEVKNIYIPNDYFTSGTVSCNQCGRYNPYMMDNQFGPVVQPSIYNPDGSGNPECDTTKGNWFIYDYGGFENAKFIYDNYHEGWSKEYNDDYQYNQVVDVGKNDYPLVKAAISFGTKGVWYTPGFGELQYIISKYSTIQKTLQEISKHSDCDLLSDSYFSSTITDTRYKHYAYGIQDRVVGFWTDVSGKLNLPDYYVLYSWSSNKNYCHRGRFMCRWSRKSGFKNITQTK